MPMLDPTVTLSSRQEAFCRHFTASGNAADAARRAGYAERSTRQTGSVQLHASWTPENIELRRRSSLAWEEARLGNDPFGPDEPHETDRPEDGEFAPGHDKT